MGKSGNGSVKKTYYSVRPSDYRLMEEVGYGASATVYRAIFIPSNEIIAVKRLDLDRCNSNLDDIRREAQTMSLIDHPNVISAYCSFVVEHYLWVVMPFMAEGSCLHLMKTAYPDGFEESVIGSILKETLKALDYLHRHGHIHRDVKAGNILLDSSGVVKVGDFGVSACMFDKGDRKHARNTFVGTPCWMAPEVLQPGSGYDVKENSHIVEESGTRWSSTKDEFVETTSSSSPNQEPMDENSRSKNDSVASTSKQGIESSHWKNQVGKKHQTYSGPLIISSLHSNSFSDGGRNSERPHGDSQLANKRDVRKSPNLSGPLMLPTRASSNSLSAPIRSSGGYGDSLEDKSKANVVQIKGRFSVTSENVDLVKDIPLSTVSRRSSQGSPLRKSASVGDWLLQSKQVLTNQLPKETTNSSVHASILMPQLQNLFQQTSFQQDLIMNLLKSLQQSDLALADAAQSGVPSQIQSVENDMLVDTATTERERLLLLKIAELQARMISLTDELTAERLKHNQLNAAYRQQERDAS